MLELIFTVCSLTHGANCHELLPVTLDDNVTIVGCMMASQIEGAKWADVHPNHYIYRATCRPAKTFANL